MLLHISPSAPVPIYRQIVDQVREAIRDGSLAPGDRLPSLRELSSQLVVNHLTVKKAYDSLEAAGLIATERGSGTFVRAGAGVQERAGVLDGLRGDLGEVLDGLRRAGFTRHEAHGLVDETWKEDA